MGFSFFALMNECLVLVNDTETFQNTYYRPICHPYGQFWRKKLIHQRTFTRFVSTSKSSSHRNSPQLANHDPKFHIVRWIQPSKLLIQTSGWFLLANIRCQHGQLTQPCGKLPLYGFFQTRQLPDFPNLLPIRLFRYVDDIFVLLPTQINAEGTPNALNNIFKSIQFTLAFFFSTAHQQSYTFLLNSRPHIKNLLHRQPFYEVCASLQSSTAQG